MTDRDIIDQCLAACDLGELRTWTRHGGTAGKTWCVTTSAGTWLFRQRGTRTASEPVILFDHGLRRHLVQHGVPTAAPVRNRAGTTFVRLDDRALEVYPFLPGVARAAADSATITAAARALARFHQVAASYPAARSLPPVAQYSTLGVPRTSDRMEDPELLAGIYEEHAALPDAQDYRDAAALSRRWLARLNTEFGRSVYRALPHTVTHGDFTLANLLFDEAGQVCGIFDLDWARWAPRIRDIADGMSAVAGRRRTSLVAGDIWSLTEPPELDTARCALWLRSYRAAAGLTDDEIRAIPLALAARWLSIRVEGMAKVPTADRIRFCFGALPEPLLWLETQWPSVAQVVGAEDS